MRLTGSRRDRESTRDVGRLAIEGASPDGDRGAGALARAQAYVGLAGAGLGTIGLLVPHPPWFDVPAMLAIQLGTALLAFTMLALGARAPLAMVRLAPALGTVSVTLGVIFSNDGTSAYVLFYIWPALFAFYFFTGREAVGHILFAALNYAIAIAIVGAHPGTTSTVRELAPYFVIITGTLIAAATSIQILRGRIESLWSRLGAAARTDLVTGVLNRRGLDEVLEGELERAALDGGRTSLMIAGVDGLDQVVGRRDPGAGDRVLRQLANVFGRGVRRMDSVARVGAAEFAVVLPGLDEHQSYLLAEQLLAEVRRLLAEEQTGLTVSFGVATAPKHGAAVGELFATARRALGAAHRLGRDRAVVYSAEIDPVLHEGGGDPSEGRVYLSTVLGLAEVLDLRDSRIASHSLSVARYCQLVGGELDLPEQRLERLRLAGLLHDIGKVGIPDAILDKAGQLADDEWEEIRRAPEMGARILGARQLVDIREWVLSSHERLDGTGYPRALRADQIPLEARVIAVADAYAAMTSHRPYQAAVSSEEACAELERCAGAQFDPKVVRALRRALDRGVSTIAG